MPIRPLVSLFVLAAACAALAQAQTTVIFEDPSLAAFAVESQPSGARLSAKIPNAISAGETLFVTFEARAKSAEAATFNVVISPGVNRYTNLLNMPVDAGSEWRPFQFPCGARRAYAAGESKVSFSGRDFANAEVRGVRIASYGSSKRPWELPVTRKPYPGSEPGAAWRAAAEARIEQHRKAELTVTVRDAKGKPVRDADVEITMRRHAFGFGSAVAVPNLLDGRLNKEDAERYREHVRSLFNKVTTENHLKWPVWDRQETRVPTLAALDWLKDSNLAVHGHVMVWPSWRNGGVPATLAAKDDPPTLAKVILEHIDEIGKAVRGRVAEWDVINEPFDNHDFIDILGKSAMVDWFKAARRADPTAKLYINDYDILSGENRKHQDHYYETIRYLIENGAPLEGIGLQSHFPSRVTPPEEVLRRLDRFAAFGRDLQITEFDIDTVDEQTQADYTRDFMTATFSHPAVKGFIMWGFWEGSHWKPDGAMIRRDWSLKPNGRVYRELVFDRWWTRASTRTSADGTCRIRGFLGDYEVRVRSGNKSATEEATLSQQGSGVIVRVE